MRFYWLGFNRCNFKDFLNSDREDIDLIDAGSGFHSFEHRFLDVLAPAEDSIEIRWKSPLDLVSYLWISLLRIVLLWSSDGNLDDL